MSREAELFIYSPSKRPGRSYSHSHALTISTASLRMAFSMGRLIPSVAAASKGGQLTVKRSGNGMNIRKANPLSHAFIRASPSPSQSWRRQTLQLCPFSTSPQPRRKKAPTMGQMKSRYSNGPFSWKAAVLLVLTGAGMLVYFQREKERLERRRIAELSKGVGRPKVGGPFVLKDLDGKVFTDADLKGKYSFVCLSHATCCIILLSSTL